MIEICLKYDNMHIFGIINAFNCINNHVINVKITSYQYPSIRVIFIKLVCLDFIVNTNRCAIDDRIDSSRQMAALSGN